MEIEIIKNPDAYIGINTWETFHPVFSHIETEHDDPLLRSDNPIVNHLIEAGYEVHEAHSTFYMGFPKLGRKLERCFAGQKRDEFQIQLGNQGWLRFRFEGQDAIYLTLFYITYEQQGKGKARVLFPQVTDALFRAGVRFMRGGVSPSYYPAKRRMDEDRLTKFYLRCGFETEGDGYVFKHSPYIGADGGDSAPASPYSQEMLTLRTLDSANAS